MQKKYRHGFLELFRCYQVRGVDHSPLLGASAAQGPSQVQEKTPSKVVQVQDGGTNLGGILVEDAQRVVHPPVATKNQNIATTSHASHTSHGREAHFETSDSHSQIPLASETISSRAFLKQTSLFGTSTVSQGHMTQEVSVTQQKTATNTSSNNLSNSNTNAALGKNQGAHPQNQLSGSSALLNNGSAANLLSSQSISHVLAHAGSHESLASLNVLKQAAASSQSTESNVNVKAKTENQDSSPRQVNVKFSELVVDLLKNPAISASAEQLHLHLPNSELLHATVQNDITHLQGGELLRNTNNLQRLINTFPGLSLLLPAQRFSTLGQGIHVYQSAAHPSLIPYQPSGNVLAALMLQFPEHASLFYSVLIGELAALIIQRKRDERERGKRKRVNKYGELVKTEGSEAINTDVHESKEDAKEQIETWYRIRKHSESLGYWE